MKVKPKGNPMVAALNKQNFTNSFEALRCVLTGNENLKKLQARNYLTNQGGGVLLRSRTQAGFCQVAGSKAKGQMRTWMPSKIEAWKIPSLRGGKRMSPIYLYESTIEDEKMSTELLNMNLKRLFIGSSFNVY